MKSRRLDSAILVCAAILIVVVFASFVQTAHHPTAAAGIGLQTLAGLVAAMRLWGNRPFDALLRGAARQVESKRWYVGRLFDGRLRSPLIAAAWLLLAFLVNRWFRMWSPGEIIGWPISILILANFVVAFFVFVVSLFMYTGIHLIRDFEPLPDGKASTALRARLAANDWVWPFIAFAFLTGGILQVAAA